MQMKTAGIILRVHPVENDRLLGILTREYGVLNAFARGAQTPRSRLASSTEQFCYGSMELFFYRDTYTVDTAEVEASFFELRRDLTRLALASYIAELTYELAPKEENASEYLRLILNTLHFLKTGARQPKLLKSLYELRLLTMAGYMPDLTGCSHCGAYEAEQMSFSVEEGSLICGGCQKEVPTSAISVTPGVLQAMRHLVYSEFERLFSFTLSQQGIDELMHLCEQYLRYHVPHRFRTLDFYRSLE